jgi:hypothetical protein
MVIVKDILCLHFSDLIPQYYSLKYLDKKCRENRQGASPNYINYPDTKDGRKTVVEYRSIPAKAIEERGIPSEAWWRDEYQKQQLSNVIPFSDEAYQFFLSDPITMQYARELAEQASWLLYLASNGKQNAQALGVNSVDEVYGVAMKLMCGKAWKLWECTSLQVFRRKLKPFIKVKKVSVLGGNSTKCPP